MLRLALKQDSPENLINGYWEVPAWTLNRASASVAGSIRSGQIVRLWHGAVLREKAEAYCEFLGGFGLRDYDDHPGHCASYFMRRTEGNCVRVLLISIWTSIDAISGYAGLDYFKARYYSRDLECLIEPGADVDHYRLL